MRAFALLAALGAANASYLLCTICTGVEPAQKWCESTNKCMEYYDYCPGGAVLYSWSCPTTSSFSTCSTATGGYSTDYYKCTSCTARSDCVWDKYMSTCVSIGAGAEAAVMGHGVAAVPSSCGVQNTYSYRTTTSSDTTEGGGGALLILLLLCCCGLCANKR